jgi:hypothetical protein
LEIHRKQNSVVGVSKNKWRVGKVVYITVRTIKSGVNIIADMTVMYYHTATHEMFYEDFVNHTFKRRTWLAVLCPKTGALKIHMFSRHVGLRDKLYTCTIKHIYSDGLNLYFAELSTCKIEHIYLDGLNLYRNFVATTR